MNSILAKFLTCIVENLDYGGVRSPLNICIFKTILNLFSYGKKAILILEEENTLSHKKSLLFKYSFYHNISVFNSFYSSKASYLRKKLQSN